MNKDLAAEGDGLVTCMKVAFKKVQYHNLSCYRLQYLHTCMTKLNAIATWQEG